MAYLYTPDRPEMGIIHKPERADTAQGRFVQVDRFFLEHLLNDKVVYPTWYATGAMDTAVLHDQHIQGDTPKLEVESAAARWQSRRAGR